MGFGAIRSIIRPLSRTLVSRAAANCSSATIPAAKQELCSSFFTGSSGLRTPWFPVANHGFHSLNFSLSLTDTRLPKRRHSSLPKNKRYKKKPPGPYEYVEPTPTPTEPVSPKKPRDGTTRGRNARKRIAQKLAFTLAEKKKRQALVSEAKRREKIKKVERKMAAVARDRAWTERLAELQRRDEEKKKSMST